MDQKFHIPVMLNEVLNYLNLSPGKVVVDATIGTGGHSKAILEKILPGGRLIGIDRDEESLAISKERLKDYADACTFLHGNFADLDTLLEGVNIKQVDAILFDLGISSYQLDSPERGFSFQKEGPLDMRLDRSSYISAYDLVNNLNEDEISDMLWTFGQERWHNRIAHLLVEERQKHPIATTQELASLVVKAIPYRYKHKHYRIHPATRTFQAVRIAVNRELEILEASVNKGVAILGKQGRICVISFHSLEDRAIKHAFRKIAGEGTINIITPKPLTPLVSEIMENPKSRSSKLRVAERIE
ncbi:MAG: 16S rRNA (cytosine(1402)-N(4))-methyltransferase RsmH [Candidatus Omnitrophica bacterium]|nr:16S rRNA (cytosine(1402)-N(4))-methyltransferase RsmH [Candidatus Omnitrophota bacterium]